MLCAVLVLLLGGWLVKCAQGRWLAPGPFFAVFWAVGLAAPPIVAPDFVQSQAAVWYIVVLMAAFLLGSVAASYRPPQRPADVAPRPMNLPLLRRFVLFGTVTGLAGTVIVQVANGYSLTSILSAQALLDAAASYSIERYTGGVRTPVVVPYLLGFTYAAGLVAPFAARGLRRRWVLACYAGPFLAAASYALMTTARLGMLTVAFFLFAGWVASTVWNRGELPRLRPRAVLAGVLVAAALAAAFVSIAFLRLGTFDAQAQRIVLGDKAVGYSVGYMPAFSQWLDDSAPTGPQEWGTSTFTGATSLGGGSEGFDDRRLLTGEGLDTTNIFTAWRFLVEDFGVAGAPLAAFAFGWVVTWAWRRTVERPSMLPLLVLLAGYAWMLNSTTQTIFLFTNVIAAFAVAAVVLSRRPPEPRPVVESPYVVAARRARENADGATAAGPPRAGTRRRP